MIPKWILRKMAAKKGARKGGENKSAFHLGPYVITIIR